MSDLRINMLKSALGDQSVKKRKKQQQQLAKLACRCNINASTRQLRVESMAALQLEVARCVDCNLTFPRRLQTFTSGANPFLYL